MTPPPPPLISRQAVSRLFPCSIYRFFAVKFVRSISGNSTPNIKKYLDLNLFLCRNVFCPLNFPVFYKGLSKWGRFVGFVWRFWDCGNGAKRSVGRLDVKICGYIWRQTSQASTCITHLKDFPRSRSTHWRKRVSTWQIQFTLFGWQGNPTKK